MRLLRLTNSVLEYLERSSESVPRFEYKLNDNFPMIPALVFSYEQERTRDKLREPT